MPPCWWPKTKDFSLAPFDRPPTIVHCRNVICVPRDWLQTTYCSETSFKHESIFICAGRVTFTMWIGFSCCKLMWQHWKDYKKERNYKRGITRVRNGLPSQFRFNLSIHKIYLGVPASCTCWAGEANVWFSSISLTSEDNFSILCHRIQKKRK